MRSFVMLIIVLAVAFGGYQFFKHRQDVLANMPRASSLAVVVDVSPSMTQTCDALVATVKAEMRTMNIRKDSRFFLITTGDAASSYFPRPKLDTTLPQKATGPYSDGKTPEDFEAELREACSHFAATESSPIFGAINLMLDQLRATGCDAAARCKIVALTDLIENVARPVVLRITGKMDSSAGPLADNADIELLLCGYAAARAGTNLGVDPAPLLEAWAGIFSRSPRFQPFCEGMNDDGAKHQVRPPAAVPSPPAPRGQQITPQIRIAAPVHSSTAPPTMRL